MGSSRVLPSRSRSVVVTGAASGLGKAAAIHLGRDPSLRLPPRSSRITARLIEFLDTSEGLAQVRRTANGANARPVRSFPAPGDTGLQPIPGDKGLPIVGQALAAATLPIEFWAQGQD